MKARAENEDWVISLRTFLRDELGGGWQIKEKKGTCQLRVRLEDGTRVYRHLGLKWNKANSPKIRVAVEEIRDLVIEKKVPLDEAIKRVKSNQAEEPKAKGKTQNKIILNAWEKYGRYLIKFKGVKESNWMTEYGSYIEDLTDSKGVLIKKGEWGGKVAWRLEAVGEATNAQELFSKLINVRNKKEGPRKGMTQEAGSDARRRTLNYVRGFLAWATSQESNYLLPKEFTPPDSVASLVGKKKGTLKGNKQKTRKLIPTLSDSEIDELLASIPVDDEDKKVRDKARMWDFCLRLCIAYGLRPAEACYAFLSVRGKIKKYIWCSYSKTTSKGDSPEGRLWSFEDRENKWDLVNRLERGDPLPELVEEKIDFEGHKYFASKAGDMFQGFLADNPVWKRLVKENLKQGVELKPYAFRHSYSKKGHQKFRLSDQEMSYMMRHSVETHHRAYSDFLKDEDIEESLEAKLSGEIFKRNKYKAS